MVTKAIPISMKLTNPLSARNDIAYTNPKKINKIIGTT